jgi:hypothetical protein
VDIGVEGANPNVGVAISHQPPAAKQWQDMFADRAALDKFLASRNQLRRVVLKKLDQSLTLVSPVVFVPIVPTFVIAHLSLSSC